MQSYDPCFGALIGARQVLTSAHCCHENDRGRRLTVNGQTSVIFDAFKKRDLCLIRTATAFDISEKVHPICLEDSVHTELEMQGRSIAVMHENSELVFNVTDSVCDGNHVFCASGSVTCKIHKGSPAVGVGNSGNPILLGIFADERCGTNIKFADVFRYKNFLREKSRAMAGFEEDFNIPTQTVEEQKAALEIFKNADTTCASPFDSITRFLIGGSDRIIGGFEIEEMQDWNFLGNMEGTCTVSLIGRHWALTAAHCCTQDMLAKQVQFGTASPFGSGGVRQTIKNFYRHPEYNSLSYANDVCILEFEGDVVYDDTIKPICIETVDVRHSTASKIENAFIAGFGATAMNGTDEEQSQTFNEGTVGILSPADCKVSHGANSIFPSQLCAGYSEGGVDSCKGDSGGPLVVVDENNQRRLAGIISWSQGCGRYGKPGVYTKVSHFATWIFEVISAAEKGDQVKDEVASEVDYELTFGSTTLPETDLMAESHLSSVVEDYSCPSEYDMDRGSTAERYDKTSIDQWPFAANLQKACSAVIIGADLLLTSAFCCSVVPQAEIKTWRMHMGGSKAIGKFKVKIAEMHIHPHYRNVNGIKAGVRNH